MQKLVSIILPAYNAAHRIEMVVTSVLAQTYDTWELLIIDDGSTDNTEEIVHNLYKDNPKIHYIKNEKNLGLQKSLNRGLEKSKGEYIARIDDDDTWCDKNKLFLQVAYLEKNPKCVLVGTGAITVDEQGKEITRYLAPESDSAVRNNMLSRNCFVHSSVLFRKDVVLELGGYSEENEKRHVEDYDLWLRLGSVGAFANIPIYGVRFLLSTRNTSSKNFLEQYRKNIKLTKKYKPQYPNYYRGLLIAYGRYAGAFLLGRVLSPSLRGKIIGMYKNLFRN